MFPKFLVAGCYKSSHPCVQIVGCKDDWKFESCVEIQQYLFAACFPSWLRGMVRSKCFVAHSLALCQQLNKEVPFSADLTLTIIRLVKKGMEPGWRTKEGDNNSVKTELALGVLPGPKGHFRCIMFSTGILQKELCRH